MRDITVARKFKFDAAHKLPDYKGKCAELHGHTWFVEVGCKGTIKPNGMVIDFKILKEKVNYVLDKLDHSYLNDIIANPTAENLAWYFRDQLVLGLEELSYIKVWESPESFAMIEV